MMREASGTEPRVFARYGTHTHVADQQGYANTYSVTEFGKEKNEALSGMCWTPRIRMTGSVD